MNAARAQDIPTKAKALRAIVITRDHKNGDPSLCQGTKKA